MYIQKRFFFVLILFFTGLQSSVFYGQKINILPYIEAWKVDDNTQTLRFEKSLVFFTDSEFIETPFSEKHSQIIESAKKYLKKKPNKRVEIRLFIYEVLAKRYSEDLINKEVIADINKYIKVAYELQDNHLLSELYILFAQFYVSEPEFIIYTIKALKIQEEIGADKFPRYINGVFDMCFAFYHTNDFQRSIFYGQKFLNTKNMYDKIIDINAYFYILDLMGANYFKLNEYEKSYHYHKKLLDTLEYKGVMGKRQVKWKGIARGNIGQLLFKQQKKEQSIPYLEESLKISKEEEVWNTAAGSQNILAQIDFENKEYQKALKKWKEAYEWTFKSDIIIQEPLLYLRYTISENISKSFQKIQQTDSAVFYLNRAYQEQLLYEKNIRNKNFDIINTNLSFEQAQSKLKVSEEKLKKEKILRNGILIVIFLLGIIIILILYQKKIQQRLLVQQKIMAEEKELVARHSIDLFKKRINEKELLIEQLRTPENTENSKNKLLNYILVTDEEWLKFKDDFAKAYPDFLSRLRKKIDKPTQAEERLLCLISLNLTNTQIATMLGIGSESVARSKRRLKNRINLPGNILLEEYICSMHTP